MEDNVRTLLRQELASLSTSERPPSDDEDLISAGYLDSLSFMRLLVFISKRFGVSFERRELRIENFRSIALIAGRVDAKLKESP